MDSSFEEISGEQKVAILLMSIGEESAAEILRHMEPRDLHRIGMAMVGVRNVDRALVSSVVSSFNDEVGMSTSMGVESEGYIKEVLVRALGHEKAKKVMDDILTGESTAGMDSLKWMDTSAIALALEEEHPQLVALVLSYLDADQAGEVLGKLPSEMAYDATMRVATLEGIPAGALSELNELIEGHVLSNVSASTKSKIGGPRRAAELLGKLESEREEAILGRIKETDEELGGSIEDLMLVFEHLLRVDDRGVQTLLREISSETLMVALRGAGEDVQEKIMRNLSRRAATLLRDDMEVMSPVRIADVEAAQREIMSTAKRLADSGEISMNTGGGGGYI